MLIKPNWEIFKAKFSENPQDNFEWLCYLLFSKEYNQPYGTHRYKNQSGIETDPIEVNDEVIGWQSKFYEDTLSNHKDDLLGTLTKTKRDNPNITKIILYTNSEWGQGQGTKEPKAKTETKEKAKELNIELVWRVQSYFESPFVCQEQREISRYFFESDIKWEHTSYGFLDTLKSKYENDFKTISLLSNIPKSIDDIFVNLAIIKEENDEEKDKTKLINREAFLSSYEEIHKPKEPIVIKELINISHKSLIYGKAGIGKTTLCKYIAYMWAKEELYQEFEYLIYIPLREWKSGGIKGAIADYYYSRDENNIIIDFSSKKVLFLFDGYDELNNDKKKALIDEVAHYGLNHYVITTRPYGYQKSNFSVNEYFETIGFTDEDVTEYIESFFEDDNEKAKKLKAYLKSNISIRHIGYIPLMLEMICSMWKQKSFDSDMTMTELYKKVVEDLLSVYSRKKGYETVYKKKYKSDIETYLGSIAFKALVKQTIIISGDFLEKSLKKIKTDDEDNFLEQSILNAGFLKSDNYSDDPWKNGYQFPHLTFQEYFSALYVSNLSKKKQKEIIQKWRFYPHMQMFFIFLSGLTNKKKKEFLVDEIMSMENGVLIYSRPYIYMLILNCLPNIKREELSKEKIEIVTKGILKEFDRTLDYPLFLEKLKLINRFIDDTIVNDFIKKIKNDEYTSKFRKDLIMFLFSIGRYNEEITSIFLNIVAHPDLKEELTFNKNKFINELISLGTNDEKNIDICFSIVEEQKEFRNSIELIEILLKNYVEYQDRIMIFAISWLKITTEENENNIMQRVISYYRNSNVSYKNNNFLTLLIKDNDFFDFYIELFRKDISINRKTSIAIFLYFINKDSSEVIKTLIINPLHTFTILVKYGFGLLDFIKKDIKRDTNVCSKFIDDLENKKTILSKDNSFKIIDSLLSQITYGNSTKELDIDIVKFIVKYYIENKNIDYQHKESLISGWFSRFNLVRDSNENLNKILEKIRPDNSFNPQYQTIKIEDRR